MATNIDPRPITSFDDLLAFTEAELEEFRAPEASSVWSKVLGVLLWIPILLAVAALTIVVCFLIWWGIYGDDTVKGFLYLFMIFWEVAVYS